MVNRPTLTSPFPVRSQLLLLAAIVACTSASDPVAGNRAPDNRVSSVVVEPAAAQLLVGGELMLRATPLNSAGQTVAGVSATWSSQSPAVASVSSAGTVTAVAPGSATIVATIAGVSGTSSITVVPPAPDTVVARVIVTPASATLPPGGTLTLGATAQNAAGQTLSGRAFTWSSTAPAVASVSAAGVVTAFAVGTTTVTASSGGKTGTAAIVVAAGGADTVIASIGIEPAVSTLPVGQRGTLVAVARNAGGQPLGGKTFNWSSAAPAIASVTATGTVTAVSTGGPVTITATAAGMTATATVTVVPAPTSQGTIAVNGAQQFQTMTGWEALMEIGQAECDPRAYQTYKNEVLDRAANEVGVNRIRIGLRNGYENPVDQWVRFRAGELTFPQWNLTWFQPINDNADPFVINPAGFNWGYLDYTIEELIIPLGQRLRARGDDLAFSLSYTGARTGVLHQNAEEYAEFVLAAFLHIREKYGLVPNALELINEPNLGGGWTPQILAANLLAAKRRLNANGFYPQFVGPTASSAYGTLLWFDQMIRVPGVAQALNEISYHRFGETLPSYLTDLAQRATQYGMRTAMLEHGGSGHIQLHEDLALANVSAWQQFGLAFCGDVDEGGVYFLVRGAQLGQNSPVVTTGRLTKYLRQYFRYVAHRAVRVGAASSDARFEPLAFRNADGRFVVVVKASAGGSFTVGGLPAGTYGIDYTTSQEYMRPLADVTITDSQPLSTSIPAAGVLTVFRR